MQFLSFTRRRGLAILAAALGAAALPAAHAQETTIKFQLDWRFEGPAALFLVPVAKGYFKAEGLNVVVDAGNGSGGTVTRVARAPTTWASPTCGADGVPRQQPQRAEQAGGGDDGLTTRRRR